MAVRCACLLAITALVHAESSEIVRIDTSSSPYKVVSSTAGVLGAAGTIRGAGGWLRKEAARSAGADALRTWHIDDQNRTLEEAEAQGLRVSAGIWLDHAAARYRNCSDLDADAAWNEELALFLDAVRWGRDSPALLWWTVGNEIEIEINWEAGTDCLWRRLEWVVAAVKREDPNHPVGTVLNGLSQKKVANVARLCPSCEFLGVNAYGEESLHVGSRLERWGWRKAFAITEYGPTGHWLNPVTPWDAYIEETSTVKAERYRATCDYCSQQEKCVGSFAFYWGWKWEKTGTWYGLFNEWRAVTSGVGADCPDCESEVVDTLRQCWTGRATEQSAKPPSVEAVEVDGVVLPDTVFRARAGGLVALRARATSQRDEALTAVWAVTVDSYSAAVGGAFEDNLPLLGGLWPERGSASATGLGLEVQLNTSALEFDTSYRLYSFVRASQSQSENFLAPRATQEAHASLAFRLCHDAVEGEACHQAVSEVRDTGIWRHPERYEGVHRGSSFADVQMLLHQKGGFSCPLPCAARHDWCHTSRHGEECYRHVRWAMKHGYRQHPEWYPGLHRWSSFTDFQFALHRGGDGQCPMPCVTRWGWMLR
eukprot:TRINITY_DN22919_c1_g2_i3.p1 TRINITY_DN22919_c1_g2~~TRINITY_DN22919_c1_g2_i3.p1  ORF type:complete len:596 (-),score=109.82 TRINITY_DN22919_c1_g2_i3:548-2335(-)